MQETITVPTGKYHGAPLTEVPADELHGCLSVVRSGRYRLAILDELSRRDRIARRGAYERWIKQNPHRDRGRVAVRQQQVLD